MNILLFLIPVALLLAATALVSFMWTVHSKQYEDLTGSSLRVLSDDDLRTTNTTYHVVKQGK